MKKEKVKKETKTTTRKTTTKKKVEKTLVCFVIDKSGSMMGQQKSVIDGFNKYVSDLKKDKKSKGNVSLTMTQFDDQIETNYNNKELDQVSDLNTETYQPRGSTRLCDAVGFTVRSVEKQLENLKKGKPNVIVVVMTDGHENASSEYNRESIKKLIEEKTKDGWLFVYLGATADAWATGASLGIGASNVATYDVNKTGGAISSVLVSYTSNSLYGGHKISLKTGLQDTGFADSVLAENVVFNTEEKVPESK